MRGIVQVDRGGDRRSYPFRCGRPLRDRSQERIGVVMSLESPANFNIERDIPAGVGSPIIARRTIESPREARSSPPRTVSCRWHQHDPHATDGRVRRGARIRTLLTFRPQSRAPRYGRAGIIHRSLPAAGRGKRGSVARRRSSPRGDSHSPRLDQGTKSLSDRRLAAFGQLSCPVGFRASSMRSRV